MKIRIVIPFAECGKERMELILDCSKLMTVEDLAMRMEKWNPPINCSVSSLRRFINRLKEWRLLQEGDDAKDSVERLAKRGEDPKLREATLAAMRQRMFEDAMDANDRGLMVQMFSALNAEKAREQELALAERKLKVAEENAKLGWRKLECQNARSGLKLLPKMREMLTDANRTAEERIAAALEALGREGAALMVGDGREEGRGGESGIQNSNYHRGTEDRESESVGIGNCKLQI